MILDKINTYGRFWNSSVKSNLCLSSLYVTVSGWLKHLTGLYIQAQIFKWSWKALLLDFHHPLVLSIKIKLSATVNCKLTTSLFFVSTKIVCQKKLFIRKQFHAVKNAFIVCFWKTLRVYNFNNLFNRIFPK